MFKRWIRIPPGKSGLIIGPRRSGKTTLLKNRYPEIPYVTLDDLDDLDWAKRDPKGFVSRLGGNAVIDEIRQCPHFIDIALGSIAAQKTSIDDQLRLQP